MENDPLTEFLELLPPVPHDPNLGTWRSPQNECGDLGTIRWLMSLAEGKAAHAPHTRERISEGMRLSHRTRRHERANHQQGVIEPGVLRRARPGVNGRKSRIVALLNNEPWLTLAEVRARVGGSRGSVSALLVIGVRRGDFVRRLRVSMAPPVFEYSTREN